ncbi:614 534 cytochrome P450 [Panus rudis PR-1116 ss-1]|nr:614 534 cytochrome P450 [Panus rudis PR-1116 ss-1]
MSPNGVASLWPSIPFVSVGNSIQTNGFTFYEQYGVDIISCVSVFPTTAINYFIADPVVTKEIMTQRLKFPKPIELYELLLFFGRNIVASERDEWKKYRKISAPAFTEPNNKLVWDETVRVVQDLFDNIWGDQKEVVSENALDITMPLALFIIGAAGFGRRLSWTDEAVPDPGHKLTFRETLYTVSTDVILKVSLPKLALYATERTRKVKLAFEELEHYMLDMIKHRRNATKKEDRYDLFSSLLDANEGLLDGEAKLTDQELLGNIFIFLIAGHETTAHTLAFALALLALHQDEQEALYQDLKKNFPDGRIPTYDDINKLGHVEAVMNETLRLFPPAPSVPKYATEDTTFVTKNAAGEKVVVPVPAGTGISLNISALQKNPRYWPNPDKFDPGRFLSNDWPRDAFVPFSGGVRSCLGRRFAELESLVVLSMFFLKYKITVKEEPQYANETWEEKRARVLRVTQGITITPVRVPLLFTRRE